MLELDEHGADAGYMTRLEAFADEIDAYLERELRRLNVPGAALVVVVVGPVAPDLLGVVPGALGVRGPDPVHGAAVGGGFLAWLLSGPSDDAPVALVPAVGPDGAAHDRIVGRDVVEQNGGTIGITSVVDGGSTVTVRLPAAEKRSESDG